MSRGKRSGESITVSTGLRRRLRCAGWYIGDDCFDLVDLGGMVDLDRGVRCSVSRNCGFEVERVQEMDTEELMCYSTS